jgi:hypothetical protein
MPEALIRQEPTRLDGAEMAGHCLGRLPEAHRELLLAISNMLAVTGSGTFDEDAFYLARVRLVRASSERRWLWRRILDGLLPLAELEEAEVLKSLQSRDMDMLCSSTVHLQHWSPAAVAADWSAYEPQIRALCVRMLKQIGHEQATLFPVVEQFSDRS